MQYLSFYTEHELISPTQTKGLLHQWAVIHYWRYLSIFLWRSWNKRDLPWYRAYFDLSLFCVRWLDTAPKTEKHKIIKKLISVRNSNKCYLNKRRGDYQEELPCQSLQMPFWTALVAFCFKWLTFISTRISFFSFFPFFLLFFPVFTCLLNLI